MPGFGYSPAMARAAIVWNEKTLERFLASPATVVPGTTMGYAGIADPQERADLIAWLRLASRSAERCTLTGFRHAGYPSRRASPCRSRT